MNDPGTAVLRTYDDFVRHMQHDGGTHSSTGRTSDYDRWHQCWKMDWRNNPRARAEAIAELKENSDAIGE